MKRCSKCKAEQSLDEFRPRQSWCRQCERDWQRGYSRLYRAQNPEKIKAANRDYAEQHPKYRSDIHRKRRYGLSPSDYERLLDVQRNCCYLCEEPLDDSAHVDHDHSTGAVRGVACRACNIRVHEGTPISWYLNVAARLAERQSWVKGLEPWREGV